MTKASKPQLLDKRQIIMVTVLMAGAALSVLNQTSASPMLPVIMVEFDVSSPVVQWLVSGFTMVTAVVVPVTAYLMKRFSTRAVYFASMALFMIGCGLCFVAPNFPVLMAGRLCQAACAGALMPLATNVMLLVFPIEKRGLAMGIYSLITSLMPAIGPAVAGGLTDSVGWRMVYVIMLALAAAVTLFAVFSLRNYGESERVALDIPSVLLSALGLVALLYGISSIGDSGLTVFSVGLVVVGVIVIAAFVVRQRHLAQPVLNMEVFRYRRFVIGLATVMVVMLTCTAPSVTMPLVVQQGLGQSATVMGLMTIPPSIVGAISALAAGRLFDRVGSRPLAITGSFILLAAYLGCTFFVESVGVVWLACCMVLSNLGMMFLTTPLNTWALGFLPDKLIPHGNAMANTLRLVAMAVSITLFVTVMAVVSTNADGTSAAAGILMGGRVAFACQAVLCAVIIIVVLAFVRPGEEAQLKSVQDSEGEEGVARDFMRQEAPFLTEEASIRDAMALFAKEGITDAPVIDEHGRVTAFLSSSDIMGRLVEQKMIAPDLSGWSTISDNETLTERLGEIIDLSVMSVAKRNVVCVDANDSFEQVCAVLAQRRIKKVPVVEDGHLLGTINRDDVVNHVMDILAKADS